MCNTLTGYNCSCDALSLTTTINPKYQCAVCLPGAISAHAALNPFSGQVPLLSFGEPCYLIVHAEQVFSMQYSIDAGKLINLVLMPAYVNIQRSNIVLTLTLSSGSTSLFISSKSSYALTPQSCLESNNCMLESAVFNHQLPDTVFQGNKVTIDCAKFLFISQPVFVSIIASSPLTSFGVSAAYETVAQPQCSLCTNCSTPCLPGTFKDQNTSSLCLPCQCNFHGDVCNVVTGADCGLLADGCSGLSSTHCKCTGHVISVQAPGQPGFMSQCNSCPNTLDQTQVGSYRGDPTNGRQCFQNILSSITTFSRSAAAGELNNYAIQPSQVVTAQLRLVIDVFAGQLQFVAAMDPSLHFNASTGNRRRAVTRPTLSPSTFVNVVVSEGERVSVVLPASIDPNSELYLTVIPLGNVKYHLYVRDTSASLNYVVFFFVFFSAFFLLLGLFVSVFQTRSLHMRRRARIQHEFELEALATRPMARIIVLLDSDVRHRRRPVGVHPVVLQATADQRVFVATYLATLPVSGRDGSTPLYAATALVRNPSQPAPQRSQRPARRNLVGVVNLQ